MMPDLGPYAATVVGAYAATALCLGGLVAVTLWRSARVKRALRQAERRDG
ncbi:MAG: heme exporter protein CcmD [Pseudomonadota bacterium]